MCRCPGRKTRKPAMKFKDYYQILGVAPDADQQQIKQAYRKKARQYHPDVSTEHNAEERFKEINEAHEALRDPQKRAEYDQLRKHGFRAGDDFRRPPNWQGDWSFNQAGANADFSDFFSSIFGQAGGDPFRQHQRQSPFGADFRARGHQRGKNVEITATISVEEAYSGCKKNVVVPAGDGQLKKTLSVTVPAGMTDGQSLRLKRQGRPGRAGGPAGDLIVTLRLQPHRWFKVDDLDITLEVPLTPLEAWRGTSVTVPTLGGSVRITIPAHARSGSRMRLRKRGLGKGDKRGDQYLVLQIALPEELSEQAEKLLEALDEQTAHQPREHFETSTSTS